MKFIIPNIDELIKKYQLKKVSNPALINVEHLPDSLFSEDIFGLLGSEDRYTKFAYIDLENEYIHPAIYDIIKKASKNIYYGLLGTKPLKIVDNTLVVDELDGLSGIELFKEILNNRDTIKNLNPRIKALMDKYEDNLIITKVLVIPPAYRPIHYVNGRPVPDPINDIYSRLISYTKQAAAYNFQLVQETLWSLFEKFKGLLSKKTGLIRGEILGKRLDFTARGVITSAPELPSDTIGVPYVMLAQIAMPFVVYQLRTGFSRKYGKYFRQVLEEVGIPVSVSSLQKLLVKFSNDLLDNPKLVDIIKEAIEQAVEDKVVLVKRDPALHQYSWEAMRVVPVEGKAIRMSHGYLNPQGGDFDGDSICSAEITLYAFQNNSIYITTKPIEDIIELTLDDFKPYKGGEDAVSLLPA